MPAHSRTPQRVYVVRRIAALAVVVLVAVLGTWAVSRALGSDPAAEVPPPGRRRRWKSNRPDPHPDPSPEPEPAVFTWSRPATCCRRHREPQRADSGRRL
jgi:hypothetical protein